MIGPIPTVLMLSDLQPDMRNAPEGAVCIMKPFTRAELLLAVDEALAAIEDHSGS
ncbi:hypothetical protein L2Y94_09975 [Luteibacter aegosomatis]|uniref:hypothetical protein n=1 Tax=Luteibacter aegosomatis TaxID=2911537 RepID=UPI001FF8225E|nr:hypothetical protein [Luteibacter aegosomatis]UPG87657.1 hypothetical protein L2Y94_09975 [Luteibacter aegosomatis]